MKKFLVTVLALLCVPSANGEEASKKVYTAAEKSAAIRELGPYQLSSECEDIMIEWESDQNIPDCAFSRFRALMNGGSSEQKQQFFDVLCEAEYEHASKQVNYKASRFTGSTACMHTTIRKKANKNQSGPLPELSMPENLKVKE